MFRVQLRAILRAAAYGKVKLLVPMVAHVSEARHTLEAIERAKHKAVRRRPLADASSSSPRLSVEMCVTCGTLARSRRTSVALPCGASPT